MVQTREFLVIVMWAGQLFGELLNWVIKRAIKQGRPIRAAFTTISGFHSEPLFFQNTLGMDTAFPLLTANTWPILRLSLCAIYIFDTVFHPLDIALSTFYGA